MAPDEIIKYHRNIALWEGLISKKFLSYCKDKGICKHGVLDLLGNCLYDDLSDVIYAYDYHNSSNNATDDSEDDFYYDDSRQFFSKEKIESIYADYCNFCEERLKRFYSPESEQTTDLVHRGAEDWGEYFNKATINEKILSYVIESYSPLDIIFIDYSYDDYYIEPEELLSFCDKEKRQKLLFNAIVSLIYNAILTDKETKSANCHEYSQLLYKGLVNRIEGEYLDPYDLSMLLKDLGPDVCKPLLLGFGLDLDDTGAVIAYIKSNNDEKVVDQIIKQREKGLLKADSKLIEFSSEFISAQKEGKFIDWFKRFSLKGDELQELNAGLWHFISKNQLFSQEILTSLKESIYPTFSFTASNVPEWAKKGNLIAPKSSANGRFISGSMEYVNKDKLIDVLIKKWIDNDEPEEEIKKKLNYFFNDGPISRSEMPQNPDEYEISWSKRPKPQLIYLLIRMLYNDKWNFDPEKAVKKDKDTGRIVIDDKLINKELPKIKGFPIKPIVDKVFKTDIRDFPQKSIIRQEYLQVLRDLVKDILECAKDDSQRPK